jgi:hypothetical protein
MLPIYTLTYRQKLAIAMRRLTGRAEFPAEVFSPMEEGKHGLVVDIARIWHERYEVQAEFRQNAFCATPAAMLAGPDWFRYATARGLVGIDALLCRLGLVHGFVRVMIGRKPGR